jgi:hypothetical protein
MDQDRNQWPGNDNGRGGIGEDVREGAQHLREKAKEQGAQVMEQVQSRVSSAVDQGKGRLADQLESVCDAVEEVADKSDNQTINHYGHVAADQIHSLADSLRSSTPADMARGAQRLARRHPDVFLGAALVTGLLIGRFLRAHEPHEPREDFDRDFDQDFSRDLDRAGGGLSNIGPHVGSGPSPAGASGIGPGISAASTGIGATGTGFRTSGQGTLGGLGETKRDEINRDDTKRDQNPPPRF